MDIELQKKVRPQATEILGLAEEAATGPVERARRAGCLDFETGQALLAYTDRIRTMLVDYLQQVSVAEGREPETLPREVAA